jgi:hypothetical protein
MSFLKKGVVCYTSLFNRIDSLPSKMLFCHYDIEADGPSPMHNNMIAIGVTFTDKTGKELDSFLGDISPLQGHVPDKDTMDWWNGDENKRRELKRIQDNARPVVEVMRDMANKINRLMKDHGLKRMIWLARPASYDWQWVNCYWNEYLLNCSPEERKSAPRMPFNR